MNQDKKSILIVSMRKKAAIFLKNTLNDVFGGSVVIHSYAFSEKKIESIPYNPTLVIASGEYSHTRAANYFPQEKILFAKRDISVPVFFDRIFLLPRDKKVLVVNETKEGTMETIEALQQMGITHLEYIPYWQDCSYKRQDIDTAISPGMLHICPKDIPTKIDIGMRQISISTFVKILNFLQLDLSFAENFVCNHKKLLIGTYKRVSEQYSRAEGLRESLQSILNNINEAIIAVGDNNLISEFNPAAEQLLNLRKKDTVGKNMKDILGSNISNINGENNNILLFNNRKLYVTHIPLSSKSNENGIYTFKEVNQIQKMEENLRKILYKKNNGYAAKYTFDDVIAESSQMKSLISIAMEMAQSDSTILITGESGTGKELFAQAIHNSSLRKNHSFIAVNFAAIPDNLVESELFGYEEGAFTGAKKTGKKGLFELAHNGTIFLDEIGDSSLWIQSRLLRVLEEKEIMRLGDTKIIPVDVRVIVATNKNLKDLIRKGLFREDLYYRLNVLPLHIPPLRERKECREFLIRHFMAKHGVSKTFSEDAYNCLMEYSWPGNIRELKNMIEYISIGSTKNDVVEVDNLPYDIRKVKSQHNLNHDEIASTIENLRRSFNLEMIQSILDIIHRRENNLIGRHTILKALTNKDISISEGRIRSILNHLEIYNLIAKGKTKQGTTITTKGKIILDKIQNAK